jgi:hypothetical protein
MIMRRGFVTENDSGMLKSGEGALLKLKPAMDVPKGCCVGVGDAVVDVDDVVMLRGESEPGSSVWRRMDDCENAVRSFWREWDGERRRDVMLYVVCCRSVLLCWWTDLICMARAVFEFADVLAMCRNIVRMCLNNPSLNRSRSEQEVGNLSSSEKTMSPSLFPHVLVELRRSNNSFS